MRFVCTYRWDRDPSLIISTVSDGLLELHKDIESSLEFGCKLIGAYALSPNDPTPENLFQRIDISDAAARRTAAG